MAVRLYVGNLPYSASEDTLRQLFSSYGQVTDVNIITDRATGRAKGFGFVEMASDTDAQSAIQNLNGYQLDGRALTVSEARERETGGGGRRGGYGGRR
jgi:RNA recognition motif-containing protein